MLFACLWLPCLPFPWVLGTGEALPPAPGDVFTWLWEQVTMGVGGSEGAAGRDPLERCAISC